MFDKKNLLFIHNRYVKIFTYNQKNQIDFNKTIDLPEGVIENGYLKDSNHLVYLIKKYFEDHKLKQKNLNLIIHSSEVIARELAWQNKEKMSLKQLDKRRIFRLFGLESHDLEDYDWQVYRPRERGEFDRLYISLIPKKILDSYNPIFEIFEKKSLRFVTKDVLFLIYLQEKGQGQVWSLEDPQSTYYSLDEQGFKAINTQAEALGDLGKKFPVQYSEISNLLHGRYDDRIRDIDRQEFEFCLYQALSLELDVFKNRSEMHKKDLPLYLAGGLFLLDGLDMKSLQEYQDLVREEDLSQIFLSNLELATVWDPEIRKETHKVHLLVLFGLVGILVLVVSFFYGNYLRLGNHKLQEDRPGVMRQDESQKVLSQEEELRDLSTIYAQIQDTRPEGINIGRISYESEVYTVNGQAESQELLETWLDSLDKLIEGDIQKDPLTSIDGLQYFKFTIRREK